jgi:hypothetical protein
MTATEESDVEVIDLDGVQHLHGNLYRVRLDLIQLADTDLKKGDLSFSNPRTRFSGGKPKGFSKEEMSELREAIRTEGLENPLRLRWLEDETIQLVSGERRYRSLKKLISDKADCFDPATGKLKKAGTLYEYVDARLSILDDREAFKVAYSGNDKAIGIGEGATIALIREYRAADWSDSEIMEATGKSITWLKDTDVLIGLDEETFTALTNEQINRSAALDLAKIEDVNERFELLDSARNFATKRLSTMKAKLQKEAESAEHKAEVAKGDLVEAEFMGDEEAEEEAAEKVEKLEEKAKNKRSQAEEIDEEPAKITSKDLQKARKKPGANPGNGTGDANSAMTKAKIQKFWYEPCAALIKNEGNDEDGNPVEIDLEDAYLVRYLCEQMEKGERDIIKMLKHHLRAKEKRA